MSERLERVECRIRDIPDFPKPGIVFKDVTPLLADPVAFTTCLDLFVEASASHKVDAIVGIESRGFIFGAALAARLTVSFVPARKPGKLPAAVDRVEYALEYGTDALEMHKDALQAGARVLIVDDLIATGGTAWAAGELVRKQKAVVEGYAFVIELGFLKGVERLGGERVTSLLKVKTG